MTTPGKNVLTKGIIHAFGKQAGLRKTGVASSDEVTYLEQLARDPDVVAAIRQELPTMKNFIIKNLSDEGSEDPVGQADAIIAAVRSGSSVANFLNIYTPGQRPGILSASGRPRTTGYTNQSTGYGHQAPGQATVSGQEDEKTPDSPFNQGISTDRQWDYESGHERTGSTSVAGSGEDVSPGRSRTTRSPRDDRDYTFGASNPSHPTASPGRSGKYDAPTSIVTNTSMARVPVKKHVGDSYRLFQKDAGAERASSIGFTKLQEEERRKEEAAESVSAPRFDADETEALARIKHLLEEESKYRRLQEEEDDDEARFEYEAKARGAATLRKQLETQLSIASGLAPQSIEKQIRRGRIFSLEK